MSSSASVAARVINSACTSADGEYTPTAEEAEFLRSAEAWLLVPLMAGDRLEAFVRRAVVSAGEGIETGSLRLQGPDVLVPGDALHVPLRRRLQHLAPGLPLALSWKNSVRCR